MTRCHIPAGIKAWCETIDKVAAMTVGARRGSGSVHFRPGPRG